MGKNADTFLQKIKVETHRFISNPLEQFSYPYVQQWINDKRTRDALKTEVLNAFNGLESKSNIETAAAVYEEISGEDRRRAYGLIDYVLDYLAQPILILLRPADKMILDTISVRAREVGDSLNDLKHGQQETNAAIKHVENQISKNFDSLEENLTLEQPQDVIDQFVRDSLDKAIKRRWFLEANPVKELSDIGIRVYECDLSKTSGPLKVLLFRELAAALARKKEIPDAKKWIDRAKILSSTEDFRTDDSRILISEEKPDDALKLIRDINSPEAKGLMLDAIAAKHGTQEAISYFNYHIREAKTLSAAGLFSFVQKIIARDDYELAENLLSNASASQIEDCPALLSVRASVRIAMCCPENERKTLVNFVPINPKAIRLGDTPEKIDLRKSAVEDAEEFLKGIDGLNLSLVSARIEELILWLKLSHPDIQIRDTARHQLKKIMRDCRKAIRFVRFAIDYNIEFDLAAVDDYLNARKKIGGWTNDEAFAAFMITLGAKKPEQVLELIRENRESLSKCLSQDYLSYTEAEALAYKGSIKEAELIANALEKQAPDEKIAITLHNRIKEISGGDRLSLRRASFQATGSNEDRRLLIDELLSRKLLPEAIGHLDYFFANLPTNEDALTIAKCYAVSRDTKGLKEFMQRPDVQELTPRNPNLQSFAAWSAYYSGELKESEKRLKPLLEKGEDENDRRLFKNLTIESGNWENLHEVLFEELAKKDFLPADQLILAAETGRVIGFPKTEDFIDAAAAKGMNENDPHILLRAYSSVTNLGIEAKKEEAITWVKRAKELSGPEGPVQEFRLRDVVELNQKWQKNLEFVTDLVNKGDAPLCIAAEPLNITLADIISGNFQRNSSCPDYRMKVGIPLFAGNRNFGLLGGAKQIALDRSALMTLDFLNLLETVFSAFDKIIIARDAMGEFLENIGKIRFHQPSQVDAAERILGHIIGGRLHVIGPYKVDPMFSAAEMGIELQHLLSAAKNEGGTVVASPPIYKAGSFMEEEVDANSFLNFLCGPIELLEFLVEEGVLGEDEIINLESSPSLIKRKWEKCGRPDRTKPLYLDNLVTDMFERFGLITTVSQFFPKIFIDSSTKEHAAALIDYSKSQKNIEDSIHRIRKIVAQGIKDDKIIISPVCKVENVKNDRQLSNSLVNLLTDPGDAEAIIIDDRAINKIDKNSLSTGKQVLIATSIDILYTLFNENRLSKSELTKALRKLRKAGVLFVPLGMDEIAGQAQTNITGKENFEFRAILDYVDLVRLRQILRMPEERTWFAHMILDMLRAIGMIWKNSPSIDSAIVASNRILDILPNPEDWISPESDLETKNWAKYIPAMYIAYLGNITSINEKKRFEACRIWVDSEVIYPLSEQRPDILAEAAKITRRLLYGSYSDLSSEGPKSFNPKINKLVIMALVEKLPESLRNAVLEDDDFCRKFGWEKGQIIKFGDHRILQNQIFELLKSVILARKPPELKNVKGEKIEAKTSHREDGNIKIEIGNNFFTFEATDLICVGKEKRYSGFKLLMDKYTIPITAQEHWCKKILKSPISGNEYFKFLSILYESPENVLAKIGKDFENGEMEIKRFLPKDEITLTTLLGQPANKSEFQGFAENSLSNYLQPLAQRIGLRRAVSLIGPICVLPENNIIKMFCGFNAEELQHELDEAVINYKDPFTLSLVLDICRHKFSDDSSFIKIGHQAICNLLACEKNNVIADFAIALVIVLYGFQNSNLFQEKPFYFRKLAAWTWAGFVSREIANHNFDRKHLSDYIFKNFGFIFSFTSLLERREAPYWRVEWASVNGQLEGLIRRRIHMALGPLDKKNLPEEWLLAISEADKQNQDKEIPIYQFFPGPLEEFIGGDSPLNGDSSEIFASFLNAHGENDLLFLGSFWAISQSVNIKAEHLEDLKSRGKRLLKSLINLEKPEEAIPALRTLCHLAGIHRDRDFAKIAVDLARLITEKFNGDSVLIELHSIIDAAAAFQEQTEFCDFIREKVERMVFGSIKNIRASQCLYIVDSLCKIYPASRPYLGRARSALRIASRYIN